MKKLKTLKEAAPLLGVHYNTLHKIIKKNPAAPGVYHVGTRVKLCLEEYLKGFAGCKPKGLEGGVLAAGSGHWGAGSATSDPQSGAAVGAANAAQAVGPNGSFGSSGAFGSSAPHGPFANQGSFAASFAVLRMYFEENSGHMRSVSPRRAENIRCILNVASAFFEGKVFNTSTILQFKHTLLASGSRKPSTVRNFMAVLSVLCERCCEVGLLPMNYATGSTKGLKSQMIERYLSKEERQALRAVTGFSQVKDHVEFAIETGLRKSEQAALTWANIDLLRREMYVPNRKSGRSLTAPLSPLAVSILRHRLGLSKPFRKIAHYEFKNFLKEAGIKDFRWHDLRHTFATWCVKGWHVWLKSPLPILAVKELLGHAQVSMTERYAHLRTSDLKYYMKN